MRNRFSITISPFFYLISAISLLILPIQWVIGWMLAAIVHELFHLIMLKLLNVSVYSIRVSGFGAVISSDSMGAIQEFLCAISGPVGALVLVLLIRIYPQLAVSAMVQSVYNLLPLYPFDGGRALKSILSHLYDKSHGDAIYKLIALGFLISLSVTGIFLSIRYGLGIFPILFLVCGIISAHIKNSLQTGENNCTMVKYVSE